MTAQSIRIDLECARPHLIAAIQKARTTTFVEPAALSPFAHLRDLREQLDFVIDALWAQEQKDVAA